MSLFNFKSLIDKYMTGYVAVIKNHGFYDESSGDWKDEKEEVELDRFAIVPISRDELRFDSGGTYNHDTRKLYCYEKFKKGDEVINTMEDGTTRKYKVLSISDYSDFDEGLLIYYLERTDLDE